MQTFITLRNTRAITRFRALFTRTLLPATLLATFCIPAHSEDTNAAKETGITESATPQETATQPAAPAEAEQKSEHVLRALLTTGIENREPVDEIVSLDKNRERIYFFTELTGLKGKIIKHRWEFQDKIMGVVNFNVGSDHWRCYSSKNLSPEWTGIWTVTIVDEKDNVLTQTYFEVTE